MNTWLKSLLITALFMSVVVYGVYFSDSMSKVSTSSVNIPQTNNVASSDIDLQPMSYISIDINPSIELILNKNQNVISYQSFTIEGEIILNAMELFNAPLDQALLLIIEKLEQFEYIKENSDIYFTINNHVELHTKIEEEAEILNTSLVKAIKTSIHNSLAEKINEKNIYIWEIDNSMQKLAQAQKVSSGTLALQMKSIEDIHAMEQALRENYQSIIDSKKSDMLPKKPTTPTISTNLTKLDKLSLETLKPTVPIAPNTPTIQETSKIQDIAEIQEIPSKKVPTIKP